uniref:Uncharacterized protein n=1 Tax=Rhodnius prolixus TaxID=13249 RepID=T1I3E6_RHOPR
MDRVGAWRTDEGLLLLVVTTLKVRCTQIDQVGGQSNILFLVGREHKRDLRITWLPALIIIKCNNKIIR